MPDPGPVHVVDGSRRLPNLLSLLAHLGNGGALDEVERDDGE